MWNQTINSKSSKKKIYFRLAPFFQSHKRFIPRDGVDGVALLEGLQQAEDPFLLGWTHSTFRFRGGTECENGYNGASQTEILDHLEEGHFPKFRRGVFLDVSGATAAKKVVITFEFVPP